MKRFWIMLAALFVVAFVVAAFLDDADAKPVSGGKVVTEKAEKEVTVDLPATVTVVSECEFPKDFLSWVDEGVRGRGFPQGSCQKGKTEIIDLLSVAWLLEPDESNHFPVDDIPPAVSKKGCRPLSAWGIVSLAHQHPELLERYTLAGFGSQWNAWEPNSPTEMVWRYFPILYKEKAGIQKGIRMEAYTLHDDGHVPYNDSWIIPALCR